MWFARAMSGPLEPIRIVDFADPRIADYRNLKDAQLARDRGRFIVEGRGNLNVLLSRAAFAPESILLSDRAFSSLENELTQRAPACPIYVADQPLLDQVVGFPIHRGVLAVCARGAALDPLALAKTLLTQEPSPRLVVLEGIINHDNAGGIFRNAMVLGAHAVLLCPRSCDPLYRKAIRTSMGGSLVVPFARSTDLVELLKGLREIGYAVCALDPDPTGQDLASLDAETVGPAALLMGTEGGGLSAEALAEADLRLRIGMEPEVDSLNVSVATAIALHRLRKQSA